MCKLDRMKSSTLSNGRMRSLFRGVSLGMLLLGGALNSSQAQPWLDFHGFQTWKSIDKVESAIRHNDSLSDPVKPTIFLEGAYEGGRYPEPGGRITDLSERPNHWTDATWGMHDYQDPAKTAHLNAQLRQRQADEFLQVRRLMYAALLRKLGQLYPSTQP